MMLLKVIGKRAVGDEMGGTIHFYIKTLPKNMLQKLQV